MRSTHGGPPAGRRGGGRKTSGRKGRNPLGLDFPRGEPFPVEDLQPETAEVSLACNGDVVETGRADMVLGDPVRAVSWLANALADYGVKLSAGEVVLSGACTRMIDAAPGDRFRADFGRFGALDVAFEASA